jgi:ribosomal protein S18 acetylase RimI-like enzyme
LAPDAALSEADPAQAAPLALLINQAYRGHHGAATGWTSSGHLLGGERIRVDDVVRLLTDVDRQCLVLTASGGLIGCVLISSLRPGVGEIGLLAVRPDHQSAGIGRYLLTAAEKALVTRWQAVTAELTVLSPRSELEAWYRRLGYRPTGRRQSLSGDGGSYGRPLQPGLELVELCKSIA